MNFQTLNNQRKFILIAAAAGVISVFLPWLTISTGSFFNNSGVGASQSVNGFHQGTGVFAFLAFFASGVMALIGDQEKAVSKNAWLAVLIISALAALGVIVHLTGTGDMSGGLGLVSSSSGIGVWGSLIGSAGVLASAWFLKDPAQSLNGAVKNITQQGAKNQATSAYNGNRMDELERLIKMKNDGSISEVEYTEMKTKLI